MRYGFLAAGMLAACLSFATTAQAADMPRIGVVNVQAVIVQCHRGQAAVTKLNDLKQSINNDVQDRFQKLKVLQEQLKSSDPKSADHDKLQKNFEQSASEYQQFRSEKQQELAAQNQQLLQPIEQELQQILDSFAKDHHYDILLNHSAAGAMFASDKYDVTTQVIEAMNKDWAEQQQSAGKSQTTPKDNKGGGK